MDHNPYAQDFETLPESLAVFPLSGALLLPLGHLPLNIFEPRYKQMVEEAMAGDRMIGMIQPQNDDKIPTLLKTGCAGKIIEFAETTDGRYLIKLAGTYRFDILSEIENAKSYRSIVPDWSRYKDDRASSKCLGLDRAKLRALLQSYFKKHEMDCDWQAIEEAPDGKLITCLSMVCPFEPKEKQALLEAACCKTRGALFMTLLELSVHERPLKACH